MIVEVIPIGTSLVILAGLLLVFIVSLRFVKTNATRKAQSRYNKQAAVLRSGLEQEAARSDKLATDHKAEMVKNAELEAELKDLKRPILQVTFPDGATMADPNGLPKRCPIDEAEKQAGKRKRSRMVQFVVIAQYKDTTPDLIQPACRYQAGILIQELLKNVKVKDVFIVRA